MVYLDMPLKCCVSGCCSNYDTAEALCLVYRLPKDNDERMRWISAIPRENIPDSKYTVVCLRHWPAGFRTVTVRGKDRPASPPSIFACVPPSQVPTPPAKARCTTKTSLTVRDVKEDEISEFVKTDSLTMCEILESAQQRLLPHKVVVFPTDVGAVIQSAEFISGVPQFILRITHTFTFDAFHSGVQCSVTTLSRNRITSITKWSVLLEAIRFLSCATPSHKQEIMSQQLHLMRPQVVGEKFYSPEVIVRAFEYFVVSRSLYSRLRDDYQLPSVRTLTKLTSRVAKLDDDTIIGKLFANVEPRQRSCIVLVDEVYVKAALRYHGGEVFGRAVNKPDQLSKTILAIMIKCLFGGPVFIAKMIPVCMLDADFLFDSVSSIVDSITSAGGATVAIICDGNRVNQSFFKKFETEPSKPWLTTNSHIFLLFDYVHILKNIRNNWITEKTQQISYQAPGHADKLVAKWQDIRDLHNLEVDNIVRLSPLTPTSVDPKPIARQKVSTCLKIFCDETISAMQTHPTLDHDAVSDTVLFLKLITDMFHVLNVRRISDDTRLRDPRRAVICSSDDSRLQYLIDIAAMADHMDSSNGRNRRKTLTKDTANVLSHTLHGMVDLARYLLGSSHAFVMLGEFSTDPLEKAFSKLRQGSGGSYFITAQQAVEKIRIDHAKLLLRHDVDFSDTKADGHGCISCDRKLSEKESEVIDNLEELEKSVDVSVKMALVYISGYVVRNDDDYNDLDTFEYCSKYGSFVDDVSRGGLTKPNDSVCQWALGCYILFISLDHNRPVCRQSLCSYFILVAEMYHFQLASRHPRVLANILLNNHVKLLSPCSLSESAQKVRKLQSE